MTIVKACADLFDILAWQQRHWLKQKIQIWGSSSSDVVVHCKMDIWEPGWGCERSSRCAKEVWKSREHHSSTGRYVGTNHVLSAVGHCPWLWAPWSQCCLGNFCGTHGGNVHREEIGWSDTFHSSLGLVPFAYLWTSPGIPHPLSSRCKSDTILCQVPEFRKMCHLALSLHGCARSSFALPWLSFSLLHQKGGTCRCNTSTRPTCQKPGHSMVNACGPLACNELGSKWCQDIFSICFKFQDISVAGGWNNQLTSLPAHLPVASVSLIVSIDSKIGKTIPRCSGCFRWDMGQHDSWFPVPTVVVMARSAQLYRAQEDVVVVVVMVTLAGSIRRSQEVKSI